MHIVTCVMITAVILLDFLRVEIGLPPAVMLLPELLSGVALLFCARGFMLHGMALRPKYVILFLTLLLSVAFGIVVAEATIGPVVGGARIYLRWIPFFLLPLFYPFSHEQLLTQMKLVLFLMLLQMPVTFLQRFVWYIGQSGDEARGTFSSGSQNAIVALSTIAVVVSLYQKRILGAIAAIAAAGVLFLPSTVGEVKGAFVLMPLAVWIPILMTPQKTPQHRQQMGAAALLTLCALASFSILYTAAESTHLRAVAGKEHRTNILDLLKDPEAIVSYLAPRTGGDVNARRYGRIDGITEALKEFEGHPMRYASGLGMGAVTNAPFEVFASDRYRDVLESGRAKITLSVLIWELGLFGTALVLIGLAMLWSDALKLRQADGIYGSMGLAWLIVVPIFVCAMLWKNTLINNPVMYLFALFSGHMLAAREKYCQVYVQRKSLTAQPESQSYPEILSDAGLPGLLKAR